ncbi:cation channel sperm-associated protein 4 [Tachyglossus aculeatus]|uniref:cation channel sperm-associated protein 4 n=1 Tax=Tachyglossus aculeatus TaxID=9261 RepID=UPI0018F68AB3|nr:cation channel sperm-associated protein 4 [Tachyglossus aculeatus]
MGVTALPPPDSQSPSRMLPFRSTLQAWAPETQPVSEMGGEHGGGGITPSPAPTPSPPARMRSCEVTMTQLGQNRCSVGREASAPELSDAAMSNWRSWWRHWTDSSNIQPLTLTRSTVLSARTKLVPFTSLFATFLQWKHQWERKNAQGENENQAFINRHDIVFSRDAWDMQEFFAKMCIRHLLQHPAFQALLAVLLVANAFTIALRTDVYLSQKYHEVFTALDDIVLTILFCEVLLGWFNGFWIFWKDGWNVLNFIIVLNLSLALFFESMASKAFLYTLRLLRLVQVCMAVEPLARIVRVIVLSVPDMVNIMMLIFFFMLVFSVFGVTLFSNYMPKHFQNIQVALYTLFICITQDGWVDIYNEFLMEQGQYSLQVGSALYFSIFITIGAFIGTNLLVVVVTTNLEQMMKMQETLLLQKQQQEQFADMEFGADDDGSPELQLVHCKDVQEESAQLPTKMPLGTRPLRNLNDNTVDDFCLVLEAIQENLYHYRQIRDELNKIVEEVRSIRFNQEQEEEVMHRQPVTLRPSGSTSSINISGDTRMDLISALINLDRESSSTFPFKGATLPQKQS